LLGADVRRI